MVTKSEVLYARFQKRAAELAGEPPEPKKKAKVSAAVVAKKGAPSTEHSVAGRGEGPGSRGASSGGATVALPCPAPISQVPGRQEAPSTDQGGISSMADLALVCPAPILRQSDRPPVRPQFPSPEPGNSQGATGPPPLRPAEPSLPGSSGRQGHQERVPYAPGWAVFEGDSALDNPQMAREVLRVALLPADQAKIRSMNYGAFMDSALCSAIRNSRLSGASPKASARARRGRGEASGVRGRATGAPDENGGAEDEIRALTAELEEEKGAHVLARSEVRAAEVRLAEAESTLAIREQEVREAHLKAQELKARLLDAQSLLVTHEREMKNLERKAGYHEAREKEAREQAQNAVKFFRESEEFRDLLEEEGVNGLIQSFKDFRNQLRWLLPDFDLNLLQPGAGVEESEAGTPAVDEAAEEGPAGAPEAAPEVTEDGHVETSAAEEPAIPEVAEDNVVEP
ncbi:translation initiation factor IF-2-like [Phoenix dactylifera]|uniref:Translation initiation factor IF-2-like n=1 Tax=Phoenix dactylifera TaxID=42345 RepID=A0A8B8ZM00_PHODC|nr:translation initiation factor IF-2-like [Phoenix dactylifera]